MAIKMSDEALAARRAYQQAWRDKNRERLRAYHRKWSADNREKLVNKEAEYWERKAAENKEEYESERGE